MSPLLSCLEREGFGRSSYPIGFAFGGSIYIDGECRTITSAILGQDVFTVLDMIPIERLRLVGDFQWTCGVSAQSRI